MTRSSFGDMPRKNEINPATLELEAQLEMLVDDELPEDERRTLLLSLDHTPEQWKTLSVRFLERQVEKKSVRQLIDGTTRMDPAEIAPTYSLNASGNTPGNTRRSPWLMGMRNVAAVLVVATLSVLGGMELTRHDGGASASQSGMVNSGMVVADVPGMFVGSNQQNVEVKVPLAKEGVTAENYPFANGQAPQNKSQHVVFAPTKEGGVVMFSVTTDGEEFK